MSNAGSPARAAAVSALLVAFAACSSGNPAPATGTGGSGGGSGAAGTGAAGTSTGGTNGAAGTTGAAGTAAAGTNGAAGTAAAGTNGAAGTGSTDAGTDAPRDATTSGDGAVGRFSFFVTSLVAMRRLSNSQNGFGGDLRYGETTGLAGADKICREVAEASMPGAGTKGWHAFLSAASGPGGQPVNAIDRIGDGPWYDRLGRVVAMTKAALLNPRPMGADPAIANDLPNEFGVPNHRPDPAQPQEDNHHVLTGSDAMGRLYTTNANSTCMSWTSTAQTAGRPRIGFSWSIQTRIHWISGQDEGGCGAGVNLIDTGGSNPNNPIVGSGGGYGGIYCLADTP